MGAGAGLDLDATWLSPAMSARASPPPFFLDVKIPDGAAARCSV